MHVSPSHYGHGLTVNLCAILADAPDGTTVNDLMQRMEERTPIMQQYSPGQLAAMRIRIRKRLRHMASLGTISTQYRITKANGLEMTIHPRKEQS